MCRMRGCMVAGGRFKWALQLGPLPTLRLTEWSLCPRIINTYLVRKQSLLFSSYFDNKSFSAGFIGGYSNVIAHVLLTFTSWYFRSWYWVIFVGNLVVGIALILILIFVPESYRFLITKGKISEAKTVMY